MNNVRTITLAIADNGTIQMLIGGDLSLKDAAAACMAAAAQYTEMRVEAEVQRRLEDMTAEHDNAVT